MMGGGMGGAESAGDLLADRREEGDDPCVRLHRCSRTPAIAIASAIVVFNPNYKREDVSPGVDTKKKLMPRALERADRRSSRAPRCHAVRDRQRSAHARRPT